MAANVSFGPNLLVTDEISTFSSSEDGPPVLDVDFAKGIYVTWTDHRNSKNKIYFAKLDKNSSSFTKNVAVSTTDNPKGFPQIEEDHGTIYVVWNENRYIAPDPYGSHVIFAKSTDGGQTFSENVLARDSPLPISMVAHDGIIYVTYSISQGSYFELWIAKSTDDGATFTKAKVTDITQSGYYPQRPAIDFYQGNVYLFWLDNRNGVFEVFFSKSTNAGTTFPDQKSVFSHPDSQIHLLGNGFGRLSTKATSSSISLAFDFYLKIDFEVYFIKSEDNGNTFSTAKSFSDPQQNTTLQSPSLTLLPDNSPVIAWVERSTTEQKIMLSYSKDKGNTFEPNIRINNTASNAASAPSIVADSQNNIHFVRLEGSLQPPGIWYTKIDLGIQPPSPAPTPFLDLPWNYESKGLSFTEAALAMSSYFDHEYPLLSATSLSEPNEARDTLTNYEGRFKTNLEYSRHDGYDYARKAKALINEPVLAAADGIVTLGNKSSCGACGNYVLIDHGNGFQTRYYHLSSDGLVVSQGQSIDVSQGQQIGKIGFSGRVIPPSDAGAHIHFMVVEDKNKDGNFEDNIPDGITDPFGWQSPEPDPRPTYAFNYGGQQRTGNKSYYLWTKPIANLSPSLTANGGFFQLEKFKLDFPQNATNQNLNLELKSSPNAKPSNLLSSIGSILSTIAKDAAGNIIHTFQGFFVVSVDFGNTDLSSYNPETLSIYSSEDGVSWTKEETTIDPLEKTASANVNHFSYFALMAERLDTTAPTSTTTLNGSQGQTGWYRSDVRATINAQDNGLGVDYTLYKINEGDWQQYTQPLNFENEGHYKVDYYSVDRDENIEDIKSTEFDIDTTAPEAKVYIDQDKQDLSVMGIDANQPNVTKAATNNSKAIYTISDAANNTLIMDVSDFDKKRLDKFIIYSLKYNQNNPTQLPNNYYKVSYDGKPAALNVKEETFEINNVVKIKIIYDKKKNQSTIFTRQGNQLKQKEIRDGLVLLQLTTNNGNLEYNY